MPIAHEHRLPRPRGLPAVSPPQPVLTIVEGTSFCRSGYDGDIDVLRHEGLFVLDTRILSLWRLRVDGAALEPLSALALEPYHGTFVGLTAPREGNPEGTIIVERRRFVARGMRDEGTATALHLLSPGPVGQRWLPDPRAHALHSARLQHRQSDQERSMPRP